MLPRHNRQAACLLLFVLILCPGIALGFGVLLVLFGKGVAQLMGVPQPRDLVLGMPVSIVMAGWYQSLRFWAMRREAFSDVAYNAVTRATAGVTLACLMGIWLPFPGAPESGLIMSQILADAFGNLLLPRASARGTKLSSLGPGGVGCSPRHVAGVRWRCRSSRDRALLSAMAIYRSSPLAGCLVRQQLVTTLGPSALLCSLLSWSQPQSATSICSARLLSTIVMVASIG